LLKFELNSKFVCVLDPEEREINFVHYFLHPVCVMDHPSCATGPASQRVYSYALKWFFWLARRWPDSVRYVRARATVSRCQDQYHHIL